MIKLLHIIFVCTAGALVLYSDEQGLMWMLGKKETLSGTQVRTLHVLVGLTLSGLIATGGILFLQRLFLLSDPTFIVKMVFVGALIVNSFFIDRISEMAMTRAYAHLEKRDRTTLLVSGAVSLVSWSGAALCGLLL